jgi:RimJ/RimL family protein N-acetyltransferase
MTINIPLRQRCHFKTERLLIESWKHQSCPSTDRHAFAKKIVSILTAEVTKTLPNGWQGINTTKEVLAWIKKRDEESAVFTIQFIPGKDLVGFLFLYEADSSKSGCIRVRLGYLLSEEVWGKGLGSELIKGLVEWCAREGDIDLISGGVDSNNSASIKILKKNGFTISTTEKPPENLVFLERKFDVGK